MSLHSRFALAVLGTFSALSFADGAPLPDPPPCKACFIGNVRLRLNVSDPSGRTKVLEDDLYFIDPNGLIWKADKDDVTDGATIPGLLQLIVGNAFENDFLPAAIIHDHYTTKSHYVRTWEATALMFYQAMVVKGVSAIKAKTMYYAVYTFGPHWGYLVAGRPCGHGCINSAPDPAKTDQQFMFRPSDYDTATRKPELDAVESAIATAELQGQPMSIGDLNKMAKTKHVHDLFVDPAPLPNDR